MSSQVASEAGDLNAADSWPPDRLAQFVGSIITMMNSGNMSRLEIEYGELRLSLRAHSHAASSSTAAGVGSGRQAPSESTTEVISEQIGTHVVAAPMIGTFYTSPAPGEPPFVTIGDHIEEGQTIGIIEAMKIMNEIAADTSGTVLEVLAGNSQSVEFGSPLIRLATAGI